VNDNRPGNVILVTLGLVVTEPSEPLRNPVNKIFGDELPEALRRTRYY
jgi:hypothetical protein